MFINSNQNTACNIINLVALAFVDPGHNKLREENYMPIRIEKIPIISYPSLSESDFRRMPLPFPIPVKITNAKYILTILLLLILVYYFFKHTEIYIPDSKEKAVKK